MMRFLSVVFLWCLYTNSLFSQINKNPQIADLTLRWQTASAGKNESYSELTVKNIGKVKLPASGWSIYFNSTIVRNLSGNDTALIVNRINGDFFVLKPNTRFKGILPGDSLKLTLVSGELKTVTDFPKGFYVVYDTDPLKGIPLDTQIRTNTNVTAHEQLIAEKVFSQNQKIGTVRNEDLPPVFPTPKTYRKGRGFFLLNRSTVVITDAPFLKEADYLIAEAQKVLGAKLKTAAVGKENKIILKQDKSLPEGAYRLLITSHQIVITASTASGVFYGIQSLKVLFPIDSWHSLKTSIKITVVDIQDEPRFGHRAFMMDVARNFQPKAEVLKVMDMMALYKLNAFHFHITDDEGWRLQIPGLPELTNVGGHRGHSLNEDDHLIPAYGSGPDRNNTRGSGFFTRADFVEILQYAMVHHIEVITEIETPGHARAAIKAMNARYDRLTKLGDKAGAKQYLLRDTTDKSVYRSVQGFNDNVINVALPSTYIFLEKVTDELIAMYKEAGAPLKTIHFGGDEVPAGVWDQSPAVAKLLKDDPSIGNIAEIWGYYFDKINTMLETRKLYLSGWEETGLHQVVVNGIKRLVIDPRFARNNFNLHVWNNQAPNEDLAYRLANAGYKVVLTNVSNMYMDLAYNSSYDERGQYWGGYVDLNKLFGFIPLDYLKNQTENRLGQPIDPAQFKGLVTLTDFGKRNIVGLQAPLWSELLFNKQEFEYLLLPKLLGLAERAWASEPSWATEPDSARAENFYNKAWTVFVTTLSKRELPRLDNYANGFSYRIPTPGIQKVDGMIQANSQLPTFTIRYTTDGTEPTLNSALYKGAVPAGVQMAFRLFNSAGRGGRPVTYLNKGN